MEAIAIRFEAIQEATSSKDDLDKCLAKERSATSAAGHHSYSPLGKLRLTFKQTWIYNVHG